MRDVGRLLFWLASLISMLACLLVLALWVTFEHAGAPGRVFVLSDHREVRFERDAAEFIRVTRVTFSVGERQPIGKDATPAIGQLVTIDRITRVPFWAVAAGTMVLPLCWIGVLFRRIWVERLVRRGLCARCRYDLRFSPERCPECGLPVARKPVDSERRAAAAVA